MLVSDTAILIILELGGLLEAMFSCGLSMVVPDLVYQRDFENHNGPFLRTLGLGVVALSSKEVTLAQSINSQRLGLSLTECFSLAYSLRSNHSLVSESQTLRDEANKHGSTVFGLLWLLDRMNESGLVQKQVLLDGLAIIRKHPRCHLPSEEVNARLSKWSE